MKRILLIVFSLAGILYSQQTQFFRTYSLGLFDVGEKVLVLPDTSYVIAGTTNTTGINGTDIMLIKTNSGGEQVWRKNIGGTGIQSGKSLVTASDSTGFFIAGYQNNFDSTGYNICLVKTDWSGNVTWTKIYGGDDWEIAHSINKLSDSTYIIAGETFSYGHGGRDMYVLRVDGTGDTLWTKTFGGSEDDIGKYILIDRHENILVVGSTESFGAGNSDVYLVYMDINGDTIWTKTFGTPDDDFGYSAEMYIDVGNQMNFVIGYSAYYAPELAQNGYIIRIDSLSGNQLAIYPQYETHPYMVDQIHLVQTSNGKITYTANYKEAIDQNSILYCQKNTFYLAQITAYTYAAGVSESTFQNDIQKTLDNGFIITGYSENWGPGPTSCILLKTDSSLVAPNIPEISIENIEETAIEIFPNPVIGEKFYINSDNNIESVNLLRINGEKVYSFEIFTSQKSICLKNPTIASGIYLLEVKTSKGIAFRKIIF